MLEKILGYITPNSIWKLQTLFVLSAFSSSKSQILTFWTWFISDAQSVTEKYRLQSGGSERDVVHLGWPLAPSYMSQWVQLCTWSPNKLWRSNSIFNLWFLIVLVTSSDALASTFRYDLKHKIDRVLGLFSSRPNWDPLTSRRSCSSPFWFGGGGGRYTPACGREGGAVPIPTRGRTLWYSRYFVIWWI